MILCCRCVDVSAINYTTTESRLLCSVGARLKTLVILIPPKVHEEAFRRRTIAGVEKLSNQICLQSAKDFKQWKIFHLATSFVFRPATVPQHRKEGLECETDA